MKIRKLIFSAKLEQIETNNQNIFIFHCNPNAVQWRFLKNFLFSYGYLAKDPNKSTDSTDYSTIFVGPGDAHISSEYGENRFRPTGKLDSSEKRVRGSTFFQSTSFKKRLAQHLSNKHADSSHLLHKESILANCRPSFAISSVEDFLDIKTKAEKNSHKRRTTNLLVSQASKSVKKNCRPKGCLFFFDTRSNSLFDSHQKSLIAMELVKKIESLEFNTSRLILLFGQMKSTVVNHIDLKEASSLNTTTTHQQFFSSMELITSDLNFCLHQKINEFLYIQEKRTCK